MLDYHYRLVQSCITLEDLYPDLFFQTSCLMLIIAINNHGISAHVYLRRSLSSKGIGSSLRIFQQASSALQISFQATCRGSNGVKTCQNLKAQEWVTLQSL